MIPPSYLFKDVYGRAWTDPVDEEPSSPKRWSGLVTLVRRIGHLFASTWHDDRHSRHIPAWS
jgi:hypothetical protein